jgi:cell division septation protein DedD
VRRAGDRAGARRLRWARALAAALLLGAAAALLVACGSSGGGLIPAADGGPLQGDIETVEQAAESGDGNCTSTEAALLKTDQDYASLPSSVDSGLRDKIRLGIENLHKVAKEACEQPLAATKTVTTPKTTSTATTPTVTTPTQTTTSTTAPTTPTPPAPEGEEEPGTGGGTPAPGEGQGKAPGVGSGGAGAEEGGAANGAEGTK